MSEKFNVAMKKTFKWEGDIADDPDDTGGLTRYGITWRVLKKWILNQGWSWEGKKVEIERLTKIEARKIYKAWYWDKLKADHFIDYISYELFDAGVNCGVRTAGKFLQYALNFLNLDGHLYPDLKVDGYIGAQTLLAYDILLARNPVEVVFIYGALKGERYHYYRNLLWLKHKLEKFFRSWLRRII